MDRDRGGEGIGTALLTRLLEIARASGFHTVMARIEASGTASRALHARCGFELVGIEREVGRKFNRWLDVAVMQKVLVDRQAQRHTPSAARPSTRWAGEDSNLRRRCRQIYSLLPLAARAPTLGCAPGAGSEGGRRSYRPTTLRRMASFDVVSEVDRQEVRNAVDQAQREIGTRFDFKNTNSSIEQNDLVLTLRSVSEDRLAALRVVLEEKLVRRGVSLKGLDYGDVEEASQNTVRQVATIKVGISSDKAREINKLIKEKAPKGVSSQTQGDSVRVNSKKRDDLQSVMAAIKAADLGIPIQFENFRN